MGFADGELEGEAQERVEKLVASSEEARRVVEVMRGGNLGDWLSDTLEERSVAGGADGIADAVMAKAVALRPSSIASARARKTSPARRAVAAGMAVFALAAGIALYARTYATHPMGDVPVASVAPSPPPGGPAYMTPSAVAQGTTAIHGVEVDEIDSPSHGVSVFEIPMAAAAAAASPGHGASVVIWIEDEPGLP